MGNNESDIISAKINSVEAIAIGLDFPYKLNNFITGFNEATNVQTSEEDGLAGATGIVRVNFSWTENTDLDPVVIDPNGDAMGFNASWPEGDTNNTNTTNIGGAWDVDDTGGFGPNQENFYWETTAPVGDYNFYIRNFGGAVTQPISISVTIKTGENIEIRNYTIPTGTQDIGPFTFNYDGNTNGSPSSALRNDESPTLLIQSQRLLSIIDESLNQLNLVRGEVGSTTNQLESTTRNLMSDYVNTKNAEGIIRDVDYAEESSNFNKQNIIGQAGTFTQSKGNQTQERVLDLLQ